MLWARHLINPSTGQAAGKWKSCPFSQNHIKFLFKFGSYYFFSCNRSHIWDFFFKYIKTKTQYSSYFSEGCDSLGRGIRVRQDGDHSFLVFIFRPWRSLCDEQHPWASRVSFYLFVFFSFFFFSSFARSKHTRNSFLLQSRDK